MRTTLKRGVGRGAGANGNGRAVFPPGPVSAVTRYASPPPPPGASGLRILKRILLGTLIVLSSLGLAVAGGAYLWFHQSVADVQSHPDLKRVSKELDIPVANHPAIALVIGYDHRVGIGGPSRSDTIMLIRADPIQKTVSLLSFPRDLLAPIYCGNTVVSSADKINSAYADCGPRGTLDTVRHLTGLPINYVITVDFHGFKEVVDKLGGVWLDIDRTYYNKNTGSSYDNYANIDLQPGYQRLGGGDALEFVRFRHTDDDFHRVARQQEFVRALKEQISRDLSITDIPALVNDMVDNIEVAQGGHKLSGGDVVQWAFFAKDLPGGHFFQPKIASQVVGDNVTASQSAVQQAVNDFVNPDVQSSKAANAAALGKKIKQTAPPPSSVTLTVLNGNGIAGAAANASYLLSQRGYRTVEPPNNLDPNVPARLRNYFHSKIYYDPAQPRSKAAALALQQLMEPADVAKLPRTPWLLSLDPGSMLMVVLGTTFHGTIAQPVVTQAPKHEPPFVRTDPSQALGLLQPLKAKVPFPLEVPTVLERNSYPDTAPGDKPVRLYYIEGHHKAVRLVFHTGEVGDYWGVEETDWSDAPILSDRSFRHDLGGREFDLYYAGSHLHMVVLQANGATYWVVNTLLDTLSNETMLAIARGLRPITAVK